MVFADTTKRRLLWVLLATLVMAGVAIGGTWWWRTKQAQERKARLAQEAKKKQKKPEKIIPIRPIKGDSIEAMIRSNRKISDFFREDFRLQNFRIDTTVTYAYNFVDLNGDEKDEAIVFLEGNGMCHTQGCVVVILVRKEGKYELKSAIIPAEPPIFVSNRKTNGWRDLVVNLLSKDYSPASQRVIRYLSDEDGYGYPVDPNRLPKPWPEVMDEGLTILAEQGEELYKFRFVPDTKQKKKTKRSS